MATAEDKFVARIKPHNKAAGHLVVDYTILGRKWERSVGWYEVDRDTAKVLFSVTIDGSETGTKVFDVVRQSVAAQLDARERAEAARKKQRDALNPMQTGSAGNPARMTTRDLRAEEEAFERATGGGVLASPAVDSFDDMASQTADEEGDLNDESAFDPDLDASASAEAPAPPPAAPQRLPGAPGAPKRGGGGRPAKAKL